MTSGSDAVVHPGQWRLSRVQVLDWGTFSGLHTVDVARQGHLFAGESGSGKSSLLDAIATVLTPARWLAYNLAAQDAGAQRRSDRSLVTYVRGAWRRESDLESGGTTATYLRTGATWSGILLRYENGQGDVVSLVRLMHARSTASSPADVRQLHLIVRREVGLLDFGEHVRHGIDVRRLKQAFDAPGDTVTDQQTVFTQRLRRVLGIGQGSIARDSENALLLLHRTQAARNLGSLDHLFRTFMLDEPRTFAMSDNAVEQFDNLDQAHQRVVEARRQVELLRVAEGPATAFERATSEAATAHELLDELDSFHDHRIAELLERSIAEDTALRATLAAAMDEATRSAVLAERELTAARREVDDRGGIGVALAQRRVTEEADAADRVRQLHERTASALASVAIPMPDSSAALAELQATARRTQDQATEAKRRTDPDLYDAHDARAAAQRAVVELEGELEALRGRRSNMEPRLLATRTWLADVLGVAESALPFAGELLDVAPEHAIWRGAIERVLRPLATTLLVREEHLDRVVRAVEERHLGTRLVYQAVPAHVGGPPPVATADSLVHRLSLAPHPASGWLAVELAERYDYACVATPEELRRVRRGITVAGQVKGGRGRYEKDDRREVGDRRSWVLGSDNEEKREAVHAALVQAREELARATEVVAALQGRAEQQTRRITVLAGVVGLRWPELDRDGAAARVRDAEADLDRLVQGNADLATAREWVEQARAGQERAASARDDAAGELAVVHHRLAEREGELRVVRARVAGTAGNLGSTDGVGGSVAGRDPEARAALWALLDERYRAIRRKQTLDGVRESQAKVLKALTDERVVAEREARDAASRYEDVLRRIRSEFHALAPDLTVSVGDRAGWRRVREQVEGTGLPEHEQRFADLLRTQSRQLVAQLLNELRGALRAVRERIDPVNASLARSPFDRDRHLRIVPSERRSQDVNAFLEDLRAVADGSWEGEDLAAAEVRFAVLRRLMTRLGSGEAADQAWRRRCLDTREHVTFLAQEIDLDGVVVNVHDSGEGLSGGQKQKLVVFCLAAALRYQLTDGEEAVPRYGTIVLDEAFDKADSAYTRMAMDVFVEFGFQMVLATPMKLLQTIEEYVGAITYVTCRDFKESQVGTVAMRRREAPPRVVAAGPLEPSAPVAG
ncbi:ATP-binding protein [Miniimonas sp. S16]|uniref:ATP-binding protein n=1 Tax=Miniimonas sp. S16 TaxID=2171623 RepID=UPI000D5284D3|nr:SbcC/MukB-like Walker B domain-containing protein [Miniimonas sp. S16]